MDKNWNLQLLTTWEAISTPEFNHQWLAMMEASPDAHVFFHPVLINLWLDTYRPLRNISPLFVFATCGEQQVIFPLVLWRRNWKNAFLRVVVPAGYSDFDYHDPVFLHPPSHDEIQGFYRSLKQTLDNNVSYDQIRLDGLHEGFLPDYMQVVHREGCLSWPLATASLSDGFILPARKSLAQDIKRRLRRLQETGEVSFRCLSMSEPDMVSSSLEHMLSMHRKRWPNAYKAPGFHQRLINQGLQAGLLDFVEMSFQGTPVAWQVNFKFGQRYSQYMPAVNEEYLKFSPGHLSLGYAFAHAKTEGMAIVDHLRGAEGYKSAWGGSETLIHDVALNGKTWPSKFRLFLFDAIERLKAFLLEKGKCKSMNPAES